MRRPACTAAADTHSIPYSSLPPAAVHKIPYRSDPRCSLLQQILLCRPSAALAFGCPGGRKLAGSLLPVPRRRLADTTYINWLALVVFTVFPFIEPPAISIPCKLRISSRAQSLSRVRYYYSRRSRYTLSTVCDNESRFFGPHHSKLPRNCAISLCPCPYLGP